MLLSAIVQNKTTTQTKIWPTDPPCLSQRNWEHFFSFGLSSLYDSIWNPYLWAMKENLPKRKRGCQMYWATPFEVVQPLWEIKAEFILERKCFLSLCCMRISVFEVMSVWPIDRYQTLPQERYCYMSWKKSNFKSVSPSWHMILLVIWKRSALAFYR